MIHIKLIIMALLWAGGFIAGKLITFQAGPFTIGFLRFFLATVILAALIRRQGQFPPFTWALAGYATAAGFFGICLYNYLFLSGMRLVDAGRASVIVSTVPIVVALIAWAFRQEKMSGLKLTGILTSVLGAWVVVSKGNLGVILGEAVGRGELELIGCVFCAAGYTLFSRQLLTRVSPLVANVCISGLGTLFLLVPAVMEMQHTPAQVSGSFIANLLYLTIGPSVVAVIFYYQAIKVVGPSRASQYMNLMPVFAVLLAFVFLGEPLTASLIVGSGLVSAGLYLANRAPSRKEVVNGNDYSQHPDSH